MALWLPQLPRLRELLLPLPEVTDEQIDRVAQAFDIACDAQRRAILKHCESTDIRACAGSGKTTLLVAKLALMLDGWRDRCRGICILSHTNVAHEEIRRRFGAFPRLRALETYPHHLGTIQSFVNMALGTPGAIAQFNVRPVVVDDDLFASRAKRILQHGSYATARGWLQRRDNGDDLVAGLRLVYQSDGSFGIESAGGDLPRSTSPTTKALGRLKQTLINNGVFRYDDMDALGLWYAKQNPKVLDVIAFRFPVVFLDETQDTAARQASLLDLVFDGRSIVQRFGDDRQAIYRGISQDEPGATFPKPGHLSMTTSQRLSPSIARLAEHVCLGTVESLTGRTDRQDHAHTVFLFAANRINEVLPAFARLVGTELGYDLPATRVMAVGFRRHGTPDPAKVPMVLGEYWQGGLPIRRALSGRFDSLEEYIGAAQGDVGLRKASFDARIRLLQAACRILELQGLDDSGKPYNPTRLVKTLKDKDHRHAPTLLVSLGKVVLRLADGTASRDEVAQLLRTGLVPIHNAAWKTTVDEFCNGPNPAAPASPQPVTPSDGIFRLTTNDGVVQVGVSTIHGVKGETMDATLVLSTYFYAHDLQQLIKAGPIRGKRPTPAKEKQVRYQDNVKRAYVAMTRPTRLLCLAIRNDQITAVHRAEMEALGWRFQIV